MVILEDKAQLITKLIHVLETNNDYGIFLKLFDILDELEVNYEPIINKLIQNVEANDKKTVSRINSILKTSNILLNEKVFGNQKNMTKLLNILDNTRNEYIVLDIAEIFSLIAVGNKKVITKLSNILTTIKGDYVRYSVAYYLGKIDIGNRQAINQLIVALKNIDKQLIYENKFSIQSDKIRIATYLGEIDNNNKFAIDSLMSMLETTEDETILFEIIDGFKKVGVGNELVINSLMELLETTEDEMILSDVIDCLGKIGLGNELVINYLIELLETTEDEMIFEVIDCLGKIGLGNELVINALISSLQKIEDNFIFDHVLNILLNILAENSFKSKKATQELISMLEQTPYYTNIFENTNLNDWFIKTRVSSILKEKALENEQIINELIRILKTTNNEDTIEYVIDILEEIMIVNND